jgi:hypothetical protein
MLGYGSHFSVAMCILFLENNTETGAFGVRRQFTVFRRPYAIEKHVLDTHMIMKIFQMYCPLRYAAKGKMQRRRTMARQRKAEGVA